MDELEHEELHLHDDLLLEFHLVREELDFILDLAYVSFTFPLIIACKYAYANFTNQHYYLIGPDYLDLMIVVLVIWVLETV